MTKLTREQAARPWINRGLVDLFVAFEERDVVPFNLFCLHQGLEKLGKAYLIAAQSWMYEDVDIDRATCRIEGFARNHSHDLQSLIGLVTIGIPSLSRWLGNRFLGLLEDAYLEGRYPAPPQRSIFKKYGTPAVMSSENLESAFVIANEILKGIEERFGISASDLRRALYSVSEERRGRFSNVFWSKRETRRERIVRNNTQIRNIIKEAVG